MKGRDSCWCCYYCGRFVSYDMRKTGRENYTDYFWSDDIYFPEETVIFYHKKCKPKELK